MFTAPSRSPVFQALTRCLWLVSLFAAGNLAAVTFSHSNGSGSASVTLTYNASTSVMTIRTVMSGNPSGSVDEPRRVWISYVSGDGSNTVVGNVVDYTTGLSGWAGMDITTTRNSVEAGDWVRVYMLFDNDSNPDIEHRDWWQIGSAQSQTVSVSPSSVTLRAGQDVVLTASGGQNGYVWNATNGGGLLSDGAQAAFTSSVPAVYVVQVYSPAGGGYSESNYATATITVTPEEKVKVNLPKNDSGRPVEYVFRVAGQIIGTETQNIGAAARTVTVTLPPSIPSGSQVEVYSRTLGVQQDPGDGTWSIVPGAVVEGVPIVLTPTTDPSSVPDAEAPTVAQPNAPKGPDPVTGDQTGKTPWSAPSNDGALTDAAYKEGVDKQTTALEKINKTLEDRIGSGSGGGGDGSGGDGGDTGTHERLDSVIQMLELYEGIGAGGMGGMDQTETDAMLGRVDSMLDGVKQRMDAKVGEQMDAGKDLVPQLPSGASVPGTVGVNTAPPSAWTARFPLSNGQEYVASLDPTEHPFVGSMFRFVRSAITWLVAVWLCVAIMKTTDQFVQAAASSQTTTAAPVEVQALSFGAATGIPSALIKAGICTALIFVTAPIMFAIYANEFDGVTLIFRLLTNPINTAVAAAGGGSWFADGLRLANALIPIDFIFLCFLSWGGHKLLGQGTVLGLAVAFRWVAA